MPRIDLVHALRAYPTLLRVGLAEAVAYRAEMLVWLLSTTMPLVSMALWSAAAESGPVGSFNQRGFTTYFLTALMVRQLTGSWMVWTLNTEIRSGTLASRLLKPVHPFFAYSAENLAAVPLRALFALPIAAIAVLTSEPGARSTLPVTVFVALFSLLGAWLINFFTMALIGSAAFFMENTSAVFQLWWAAFTILSGYVIPLELFPPGIRAVTHALPFRYNLALPVEILIGTIRGPALHRDLGIQWAYVAGTGASALLLWRAGIKRFSAYGG